ncbi:hypothetical protein KQ313_03830, partial [Synechococcus sp. CS-1325]|uniref:hypothetical protein n=1 Tax=Synechococcus sp. CS-1325 TaxID=2847979 RepID=UPI00223A804E
MTGIVNGCANTTVVVVGIINNQQIGVGTAIHVVYSETGVDRVIAPISDNVVVAPDREGNGVSGTTGAEAGEGFDVVDRP